MAFCSCKGVMCCQSCAMPLKKDGDFGTNSDKSRSRDYCCYCYRFGKFTDSNMTMDEMIEKAEMALEKMKIAHEEIVKVKKLIPTLKRWKNKK